MLKTAVQGLKARINNTQNRHHIVPAIAIVLQRRCLSNSQRFNEKFIIKDHYDFDQKVINSENPVVVNFHAGWCDPCNKLTPKMTELLQDSKEVDLAIIDVDTNAELVEAFEVEAVPSVLAFRNGVVVDKFVGLVEVDIIENLINKLKRKKPESDDSSPKQQESDVK